MDSINTRERPQPTNLLRIYPTRTLIHTEVPLHDGGGDVNPPFRSSVPPSPDNTLFSSSPPTQEPISPSSSRNPSTICPPATALSAPRPLAHSDRTNVRSSTPSVCRPPAGESQLCCRDGGGPCMCGMNDRYGARPSPCSPPFCWSSSSRHARGVFDNSLSELFVATMGRPAPYRSALNCVGGETNLRVEGR